MEGKAVSLEEQFWNTLQRAMDVLGPTKEEPPDLVFSMWYKNHGKDFVETLRTHLPFYADTYDGQRFLNQAVYTLDVGLDGYENHDDKEYLTEMTALAIEDLYLEVATEQ